MNVAGLFRSHPHTIRTPISIKDRHFHSTEKQKKGNTRILKRVSVVHVLWIVTCIWLLFWGTAMRVLFTQSLRYYREAFHHTEFRGKNQEHRLIYLFWQYSVLPPGLKKLPNTLIDECLPLYITYLYNIYSAEATQSCQLVNAAAFLSTLGKWPGHYRREMEGASMCTTREKEEKPEGEPGGWGGSRVEERVTRLKVDVMCAADLCGSPPCECERTSRADLFRYLVSDPVQRLTCCMAHGGFKKISQESVIFRRLRCKEAPRGSLLSGATSCSATKADGNCIVWNRHRTFGIYLHLVWFSTTFCFPPWLQTHNV